MGVLFLLIGAAAVVVVVLAIVNEWKSTGPFRALTYGGWVVVWALYDEVRSFGWKKGWLGFSKAEFAEMERQGWPRLTDDPNVTK